MKLIILGNAGSGKTTFSRRLLAGHPAARLSLDEVAFDGGIERRPLHDSIADVRRFIAANEHWIIEGCYADILESVLPLCDELVFLNPGMETCIAHCRARPWEPDKFASSEAQNEHLENLIDWVRTYETRDDEYGLRSHRRLFDVFKGKKRELNNPADYGADDA